MVLVIIPFPATSQVSCIPKTMVLEKIQDIWSVKSIMSGVEVFLNMIQGMYNNYVIMGDTMECYSVTLHIETWNGISVTWGWGAEVAVHVQINAYSTDKGKRLSANLFTNFMTPQATRLYVTLISLL